MHPVLNVAAKMGQGGDSTLGHLSPGDVVVPVHHITPDVHLGLQRLFAAKNLNKDQFTVGSPANKINPSTGLAQFDDSDAPGPGGGDSNAGTPAGDSPAGDNGTGEGQSSDTSAGPPAGAGAPAGDMGAGIGESDQSGMEGDAAAGVTGGGTAGAPGTPSQSDLASQLASQQEATNANVAAGGHGFGVPGVDTDVSQSLPTGMDSALFSLGLDTQNPGKSVAEFGLNAVLGTLATALGLGPVAAAAIGLGNSALGHTSVGNFGQNVVGAMANNPGTPTAPGVGTDNSGGGDVSSPDLTGTAFNQPVGNSVGTPIVQSSSPTTAAAPQSNFGTGIDDIVRRAGLA